MALQKSEMLVQEEWPKKQSLTHARAISCKIGTQRGVDKKIQALHSDILDDYSYI